MRSLSAKLASTAALLLVAGCSDVSTAPAPPRAATVRPTPDVVSADVGTTVYASEVVAYQQGPSSAPPLPIEPSRSNPSKALGAPDSNNGTLNFFSLGYGGWIVVKLPYAVSGSLVVAFETTFIDPTYPEEKADVYVSKDGVNFVLVGRATNQVDLDKNDHKSTFVLPSGCWQYIKVVDRSVIGSFDAFDVDAVGVENAIPCTNGCSAGYYSTHDVPGDESTFASWGITSGATGTGYAATYTLEHALDNAGGGPTLQDAKNILLRQAAAALLNSSLVAGYPKTAAELQTLVNNALASGVRATILALASDLDGWNNLTCALGNSYPHE